MKDDYYNGALGDNIDGFNEELFERALDRWTERPQLGEEYDKRTLRLYDALIWMRVENTKDKLEQIKGSIEERSKIREKDGNYLSKILTPTTNDDLLSELDKINRDVEGWKYTGGVYRVINCRKYEVEFHKLIASWVSDVEAFKSFNHLYKKSKYTFLIGNTGRDWAFDVNKYRKYINNRHQYTEHESEIILPMDEEYVADMFYGTLEEFYKYIKTKD